ncbi:MAG: class I lanthipeptide [Bacteroidota bacterium]
MKKKRLKNRELVLHKSTISNLQIDRINGGETRGDKGNDTKYDCTIRSVSIFTTSCEACPLPGNETNTF